MEIKNNETKQNSKHKPTINTDDTFLFDKPSKKLTNRMNRISKL